MTDAGHNRYRNSELPLRQAPERHRDPEAGSADCLESAQRVQRQSHDRDERAVQGQADRRVPEVLQPRRDVHLHQEVLRQEDGSRRKGHKGHKVKIVTSNLMQRFERRPSCSHF